MAIVIEIKIDDLSSKSWMKLFAFTLYANVLRKGMNPFFLYPIMGK